MASRKPGKWAVELKNLKEIKLTFRDIAKAVEGKLKAGQLKYAGIAVQEGYQKAAIVIRDRARANAQSGGAPRRLYAGPRPAIFAFSDFDSARDDKRKRSSMVGVRTGLAYRTPDSHLYVRWDPRSNRRSKDNSRIGFGGLSISFGRLFESGTKDRRIKPLRYFRSAIFQTRGTVISILTRAYQSAATAINALKNT